MPTSRLTAARACALALAILLPLFAGCASKAPVGCSGPKHPVNDRAPNAAPSAKP